MKLELAAILLVMYDYLRQSSAKFVLFRSANFTTSVYLWTDRTYTLQNTLSLSRGRVSFDRISKSQFQDLSPFRSRSVTTKPPPP